MSYKLRIGKMTNDKWLRAAFFLFLLAVLSLCFPSCGGDPLDIDVSNIQVEPAKIQRFDQDFFSLTADNIEQKLPELQKKYPEFTELYIRNLHCPKGIQDSACYPDIIKFIRDKDISGAYEICKTVFPDLSETEKTLTDVFRHYAYYFPGKELPKLFAMMSGFNYAIANTDPNFAIGLDMYIGPKSKYYEMLHWPVYKQQVMRKEYIPVDLVRAWMMREYPNTDKSGTLLGEMIYQGKLLYLSDALMPETDDTLKIGFSKKQLDWCVEHEKDMWGHFIQNKFLYSNEKDIIAKFTGEGPFTTGFVKESPARTGVWIGWNIVKSYMEENPEIKLEELMKDNNAQVILSKSKYKP